MELPNRTHVRQGAGAVALLSATALLEVSANANQTTPGWWFAVAWVGLIGGLLALGATFTSWRTARPATQARLPRDLPGTATALPRRPDRDEAGLSEAARVHPERTYVGPGITVAHLMDLCRGKTSSQGARLTAPFVGKWIRISGSFQDVSQWRWIGPGSGIANVKLDGASIGVRPGVGVHFMVTDKAQADRFELLAIGDPVMIEGRIDEITSVTAFFHDCELAAYPNSTAISSPDQM